MPRLDLSQPKWDQSTYWGRARHFFKVTNPFYLFATPSQLDNAKSIVEKYKAGEDVNLPEENIWDAKYLHASAHHPDTGDRQLIIGRMSSQVPVNILIIAGMLGARSTPVQFFWQWFNQTYNATVNYTNRSGGSEVDTSQLAVAYVGATGGAMGTVYALGKVAKKSPALGKVVPFIAVCVANLINIPCMRFAELQKGIDVYDENGKKVGQSVEAGKQAISKVVLSRNIMASPSMIIPPIIMTQLEKGFLKRKPPVWNPICQVILVTICLCFATPMCCAIFPQKDSMPVSRLEKSAQEKFAMKKDAVVYFNKGL